MSYDVSTLESPHRTVEERIRALAPWFHNMNLCGVQTAPGHFLGDYPAVKWNAFEHAIPPDLTGQSVLDIGCNAGFFAIQMKQRGAASVVAIDTEVRYLQQARLAAELSGVELELHRMSVYDIARLGRKFDVVLFMGVIYHLRHPLLALDLIHEHVAADLLVFQSMLRGSEEVCAVEQDYDFWEMEMFDEPGFPKMHFIENRYSGDPTNWWAPNRACAEAMLRSAGFDVLERPEAEVFICRRKDLYDGPQTVYPTRPRGTAGIRPARELRDS